MEGWIQLHRQLQDNPLWTCEPFTRGQAWVDLLMLANHKDSYFYKRNIKIDVKRGELARSEVELSDRWKWSRSKVRNFLNDLEKEQQIVQQKTNVTQHITIVNYNLYQQKEQQGKQQKNSKKTAKEQQEDTYNNDNNEEQGKKCKTKPFDWINESYIDVFNIWMDYKKSRREKYKSENSMKTFYNKLVKMSSGSPYKAKEIIEQSMANNWAGIFQLKNDNQKEEINRNGDFMHN